MNSDLSARLGALLLGALLLCGLFSGCGAQQAASSGGVRPVSPPAGVSAGTPAKVTEPPGLSSSETRPDAAPLPVNQTTEPEPSGLPSSEARPDAAPPSVNQAAEPEPPGLPSSETRPDAVPPPVNQAAEPEPSNLPSSEARPDAVPPPATGAAEPEPPPAASSPAEQSARPTALTVRIPAAPGKDKSEGGGAVIDYSNRSEGYVMVKYSGGASRVKIQITGPDKTTYTYDSSKNGFEAFPLTAGNGGYTVNVYTEIHSSQYALAQGASFQATLTSGLLPYLYPSQYVNYTAGSKAVAKGEELASSAATVLEVVGSVYNYVISNVTYDDYKAANVKSGYLPDPDDTLAAGKGICFDYAALLATMLRSQGIPTRLEVGYVSGGIYHAWISVYTTETGWINGIIQFDGKSWKLLDPTFASNGNQSSSIMQFIGNGSNYQRKYCY